MQEELSRPRSDVQFPLTEPKLGTGFFEINTASVITEKPPVPAMFEKPPALAVFEKPPAFPLKNPQTGNETATLLTNADLLCKHGETDLAVHLLRKCLYLNGHHSEALKRLSLCLTQEKQLPLKTKVCEALVKQDLCFENMARLGHCYYQQNLDSKAREIYLEALSLMTDESAELFELFKNLGNICMREGDFDSAEEYYNKAFTLQPSSDALHINLGTLALQQQALELALSRFRLALEINARNDKAWVGLALVHNEMGDHVLSKANLENAIDINPRNRTAVHLAASWAVRDQNYPLAISALENFVSEVDCDEEMSLLLIHLFCVRGQYVEANLELERLLLWDPGNEKLLMVEQEIRNAKSP
jgi:tetratricopeptide (TPR) repeat protein